MDGGKDFIQIVNSFSEAAAFKLAVYGLVAIPFISIPLCGVFRLYNHLLPNDSAVILVFGKGIRTIFQYSSVLQTIILYKLALIVVDTSRHR